MARKQISPAHYEFKVANLTAAGHEKVAEVGKRYNGRGTTVAVDEDQARRRFALEVNRVFGVNLAAEDVILAGES